MKVEQIEGWLVRTGAAMYVQEGAGWEHRLCGDVLLRLGVLCMRARLGCW